MSLQSAIAVENPSANRDYTDNRLSPCPNTGLHNVALKEHWGKKDLSKYTRDLTRLYLLLKYRALKSQKLKIHRIDYKKINLLSNMHFNKHFIGNIQKMRGTKPTKLIT